VRRPGIGRAIARLYASQVARIVDCRCDATGDEGGMPTIDLIAEEDGNASIFPPCLGSERG